MANPQPQTGEETAGDPKPVPKDLWDIGYTKNMFETEGRWIRRYPSGEFRDEVRYEENEKAQKAQAELAYEERYGSDNQGTQQERTDRSPPRGTEQIFIDRMGRTREIDMREVHFRVVNWRKGLERVLGMLLDLNAL